VYGAGANGTRRRRQSEKGYRMKYKRNAASRVEASQNCSRRKSWSSETMKGMNTLVNYSLLTERQTMLKQTEWTTSSESESEIRLLAVVEISFR